MIAVWHAVGYTVGIAPLVLITLGIILLACSKSGRTSSPGERRETVLVAARGDVRRVVEHEPTSSQLAEPPVGPSTGSGLPGRRLRRPESLGEPDFYVEIDGVEFGGWHK